MSAEAPAREDFERAVLRYVNEHLLADGADPVEATTPLFERGRIDSLQLLHLLAFVEKRRGIEIPEEQIVMDRFATVRRIAQSFGPDG